MRYRRSSLAILLVLAAGAAATHAQAPETVVLFDPSVPETPESVRFDRFDNAFVMLGLTGEIRKIARDGTQSTVAFLPIGAPCGGLFPPVAGLGLAFDMRNRLYAGAFACDPANSGIWRIDVASGALEQIAGAPSGSVLNGLDVYQGFVYAGDSFGEVIWRAPIDGGMLELWSDDSLLEQAPGSPFPGPNGVRVFRRTLYVANSSSGAIVAIPILADGSAGEARLHATLPPPQGCDEFAIDVKGSIYCTTDPFNTVVRLDPDGTVETLLTLADGLDGPTSATFGRRGRERKNLYITNAAFPFLPGPTPRRPSLMRLRLGAPGAPE